MADNLPLPGTASVEEHVIAFRADIDSAKRNVQDFARTMQQARAQIEDAVRGIETSLARLGSIRFMASLPAGSLLSAAGGGNILPPGSITGYGSGMPPLLPPPSGGGLVPYSGGIVPYGAIQTIGPRSVQPYDPYFDAFQRMVGIRRPQVIEVPFQQIGGTQYPQLTGGSVSAGSSGPFRRRTVRDVYNPNMYAFTRGPLDDLSEDELFEHYFGRGGGAAGGGRGGASTGGGGRGGGGAGEQRRRSGFYSSGFFGMGGGVFGWAAQWAVVYGAFQGIGRLVESVLDTTRELNEEMVRYQIETGKSGQAVEQFSGRVKEVSRAVGLPMAEVAGTVSIAERAVLGEDYTRIATQLQRAYGVPGIGAIQSLVTLQQQFPGISPTQIGDMFAGLVQRTPIADIQGLFKFFGQEAGLAGQYGMNFQQYADFTSALFRAAPTRDEGTIARFARTQGSMYTNAEFRNEIEQLIGESIRRIDDRGNIQNRPLIDVLQKLSTQDPEAVARVFERYLPTGLGQPWDVIMPRFLEIMGQLQPVTPSDLDKKVDIARSGIAGATDEVTAAWQRLVSAINASDTIISFLNGLAGAIDKLAVAVSQSPIERIENLLEQLRKLISGEDLAPGSKGGELSLYDNTLPGIPFIGIPQPAGGKGQRRGMGLQSMFVGNALRSRMQRGGADDWESFWYGMQQDAMQQQGMVVPGYTDPFLSTPTGSAAYIYARAKRQEQLDFERYGREFNRITMSRAPGGGFFESAPGELAVGEMASGPAVRRFQQLIERYSILDQQPMIQASGILSGGSTTTSPITAYPNWVEQAATMIFGTGVPTVTGLGALQRIGWPAPPPRPAMHDTGGGGAAAEWWANAIGAWQQWDLPQQRVPYVPPLPTLSQAVPQFQQRSFLPLANMGWNVPMNVQGPTPFPSVTPTGVGGYAAPGFYQTPMPMRLTTIYWPAYEQFATQQGPGLTGSGAYTNWGQPREVRPVTPSGSIQLPSGMSVSEFKALVDAEVSRARQGVPDDMGNLAAPDWAFASDQLFAIVDDTGRALSFVSLNAQGAAIALAGITDVVAQIQFTSLTGGYLGALPREAQAQQANLEALARRYGYEPAELLGPSRPVISVNPETGEDVFSEVSALALSGATTKLSAAFSADTAAINKHTAELERARRKLASEFEGFLSGALRPSAVTDLQFAQSRVGLYQDQPDEQVRRARSIINKLNAGMIEQIQEGVFRPVDFTAEEYALINNPMFAQYFPGLLGNVGQVKPGDAVHDERTARLAEFERLFYSFQIPGLYDYDALTRQYIDYYNEQQGRKAFYSAAPAEILKRLPAGFDTSSIQAFIAEQNEAPIVSLLTGGKSSQEIGADLSKISTDAIEQIGADWKTYTSKADNMQVFFDAGESLGVWMMRGIIEGMKGMGFFNMVVQAVMAEIEDATP